MLILLLGTSVLVFVSATRSSQLIDVFSVVPSHRELQGLGPVLFFCNYQQEQFFREEMGRDAGGRSKYLPLRLRGTPIDFRTSDWVKAE